MSGTEEAVVNRSPCTGQSDIKAESYISGYESAWWHSAVPAYSKPQFFRLGAIDLRLGNLLS